MLSISFDKVTKRYNQGSEPALCELSLVIPRPGVFGLLGPNGAGKTTLLRLTAALLRPTAGHVKIGAYDTVSEPALARRQIGYVPQEYTLYSKLTAWEFLDYMALLSRVDGRHERIEETLKMVGLHHAAHRPLRTFSGGMKQRVAIAQAVLHRPPVLLVDEPTTGLDPEERIRFRNWLLDFGSQNTVVFSTHLVEDIAFVSDQLAVLWRGRLLFSGRVADMIQQAEGKVWRVRVPRAQWQARQSSGRVIDSRVLEDRPGWFEVRYIREEEEAEPGGKDGDGEPVSPSLNNAYFYLLKKTEAALERRMD